MSQPKGQRVRKQVSKLIDNSSIQPLQRPKTVPNEKANQKIALALMPT
jgi:hypothetical protein